MAGEDQIVRLMKLAHALSETRTGIVVRQFADTHGYSRRAVYRDIKTLESAGYPIYNDGAGYRLIEHWRPPSQVGIDRDEALALLLAKQLLGHLSTMRFAKALDRLWSKLGTPETATTPPTMAIRSLSAIDYSPHQQHIATLEKAITTRRHVRIVHRRADRSVPTERIVEPGELYLDTGLECLFLIAWCRLRGAVRCFAVHRIQDVTLLTTKFQFREDTLSKNALRTAFRAWRSDRIETVHLHFSANIAREIRERQWHPSQTMDDHPDGALALSMDIAEPLELERWILGYGPDVTVLAPNWLARRVSDRHRLALVGSQDISPRMRKSPPIGDFLADSDTG